MKTITHKGFEIKIYQDEYAESPDLWGNDDAFVVYDHRVFCVERKGFDGQDIFDHINETKRYFYNGYWVFPLYAYIHSGVSLSLGRSGYPFNCRWDTSYKGFVLVKRQKGWSYTRTKAEAIAQSIVNEWNDYLCGNVWGYNWEHGGCRGYYGDPDEYMIKEAISEVDSWIEAENRSRLTQNAAKIKVYAKNHVPLQNRKLQPLITQQ